MNIVVVSVQTSDANVLAEPAEKLRDHGIEPCVYAINSDDADDDALVYHELADRTREADYVFVRCMADPNRFKRFGKYEKVLKECRGIVLVYSGSADITIMCRHFFRGTDEQFSEICRYPANRGYDNEYGMYLYAAGMLGLTSDRPAEIVERPKDGIYHPGISPDAGRDAMLSILDPSRPTVGILFASNVVIYRNTAHMDSIIRIFNEKGLNVFPVYYTALSFAVEGNPGTKAVIEKYFMKDGRSVVDAVITLTSFSVLGSSKTVKGVGTEDEENFYHTLLGVPVLHGMGITGEYSDYEKDKIGLNKHEISANVAFPEIDGDIIGFPLSYTPKKSGSKHAVPIEDRIERMADLALAWARLNRIPVGDRRVAVILWQSRPDSGRIGNAAGLDTPESVANILKRLDSEGYTVESVPEDGRRLMDEILSGITNDLDNVSTQELRGKAADLVNRKVYAEQFSSIPEWDQGMMRKDWGEPPGTICVDGNDIVIPGLVKGNVLVSYQPLRGSAEKMEANIHDPELFAQHQYLAYYRWIRDVFRADMVIHVGTHGTIEWLPGRNTGMSAKCDPDVVLGGLPNLYIYIIDDPGEGIQCKRRISSVMDGHMPPSMARAGRYDEIHQVEVPLQEYFELRASASPERMKVLVSDVYEAAKKNDMFNDLGLEEDPGADGFAEYIPKLHDYISEVKDALVRSDLHVLGNVPSGTHFDEMVYSLTRLDNGGIQSLRTAFAENAGIDILEAMDDPCGAQASGELNSAAIDRIDDELQSYLADIREHGYDTGYAVSSIERMHGRIGGRLKETLEYVCGTLVPNIRRMDDELQCLVDGCSGRYILPGPSGAPTRGNADILPMGRNFYSLDPDTVPTKAAWTIGGRMADQMIDKYVSEKGEYPREIGFVIWATDTMKTGGDDIAYILWLMGVRPVWSETGGQVVDLEVIPVGELGRPRIDVTVNITGLFRDTFPNLIDMIDDAVKLVIGLDETDEENSLAANLRRDITESIACGIPEDEAIMRNSVRIFGAPPGGYGTGVNKAIETGSWKTVQDLADVYMDWCSNGYSKGSYGISMRKEFVRRFGRVAVTVKNMPDREIDLLDCDDVYEYLGGMNAFVRAYGRKDAVTFMGDGSDPKRTKVRSTKEEMRFAFRSKVLNPKFINGLKEHGYRGAAELANVTEYTLAWGATSDIAEGWMYEGITDKFLDDATKEWMKDVNPHAMMNILNRLAEAIDRGLWDADEEYRKRIEELYLEAEERIEEMSDR